MSPAERHEDPYKDCRDAIRIAEAAFSFDYVRSMMVVGLKLGRTIEKLRDEFAEYFGARYPQFKDQIKSDAFLRWLRGYCGAM